MEPAPNDRWTAPFAAGDVGVHEFTLDAWGDRFASWRGNLEKKHDARLDVRVELLEGAALEPASHGRRKDCAGSCGTRRPWAST